MKYFILILIFLSSITVFSQDADFEKPNFKKIKREIAKEKTGLYYPKLMEKFQQGDTSMTLIEKRHLYYGYIYQSEYSPYGGSDYSDSLRMVLNKENHSLDDLINIDRFADLVLKETPFDLRAMSYQLYALEKVGGRKKTQKRITQMKAVLDALFSSGDGIKKKTAFCVIYVSHEYDLLNVLGLDFGGEQSLIEHYDYLKLSENNAGIKGLYFDITPCLASLDDVF